MKQPPVLNLSVGDRPVKQLPDSAPLLDWHINDNYSDALSLMGPIPALLTPASQDPAYLQLAENLYWNPEPNDGKWKLMADDALFHTGLPPVMPVAMAHLRGERILIYPAGWVVIAQLNGEFSICKMF